MKFCNNLINFCLLLAFGKCESKTEQKQEEFTFDKEFVGVAFSPYVKDWEGHQTPQWNTYSLDEIKIMLKIISSKFQSISTYGMGVAWFLDYESAQEIHNKTLDEVDSNGKIAKAAALLNNETRQLSITMSQGIYQVDTVANFEELQRKEIDLALSACHEANTIYPGTVWGVTFTNNYVTDSRKGTRLLNMIRGNKERVKAQQLKLGIRINNCFDVATNGVNRHILKKLITELDYVMCILHPKNALVKNGTKNTVLEVAKMYFKIEEAIKRVKPDIEVIIGETGWPSKGKSYNDSPNNIENLKSYWFHMAAWAHEKKVKVQMFEAFDEPWKSDVKIMDSNNPGGFFGAERHYGWWRRKSNDDIQTYIEKISDTDLPLENKEASSSMHLHIGMILMALIFLLLLLVSVFILTRYFKRRLHKTNASLTATITDLDWEHFKNGFNYIEKGDKSNENYLLPLSMPYDPNYELRKTNFSIDKEACLGSGAFGVVYRGKIENVSDQVAFKMIKPENADSGFHLKNLLSEIKIMIYIGRHENIVCLLGAYTSEAKNGLLVVATELCELGSLEEYLRSNKAYFIKSRCNDGESLETSTSKHAFGIRDLVQWSFEIASAMDHLEKKKVAHADLATRNVLLTGVRTAKVTDFGLSRRMYEYTEYVKTKQEPLPWRWMAVETLQSMIFSSKSDVWSYGITLWEIYSLGALPYSGLAWSAEFADLLEDGLRLHCPKYAPPEIFSKIENCWELEPENRPDFNTFATFFQNMIDCDDSSDIWQIVDNDNKRAKNLVINMITNGYANLADIQYTIAIDCLHENQNSEDYVNA